MVSMILNFNQPEPWLLTANVKEATVKSTGNARSILDIREIDVNTIRTCFLLIFMANAKATTKQSTTFVRYLMTFPISDVW